MIFNGLSRRGVEAMTLGVEISTASESWFDDGFRTNL
jgi:hypothetical protein